MISDNFDWVKLDEESRTRPLEGKGVSRIAFIGVVSGLIKMIATSASMTSGFSRTCCKELLERVVDVCGRISQISNGTGN